MNMRKIAIGMLTHNDGTRLLLSFSALDEPFKRLGGRYHIEGRWHRVAVLEVTYPQVTPCELPFCVGSLLQS